MCEEVRKEDHALQGVGGQWLHVGHGANQSASSTVVVTAIMISITTATTCGAVLQYVLHGKHDVTVTELECQRRGGGWGGGCRGGMGCGLRR